MAFAKKAVQSFDPTKVTYLALEALKRSQQTRAQLPIRATLETPMLMHRWSAKAFLQMLGGMVGIPEDKGLLDLTEKYENSYYRSTEGKLVVPCRLIKAVIEKGATGQVSVTGAEIRRMLRVVGWTSPIVLPRGKEVTMQVDIGRTSSGTPLPISRANIPEGSTFDFVLDFPCVLHPDKVMTALTNGFSVIGIGDWRPDKGGIYGTARVEVIEERAAIAKIVKACEVHEDQFQIPPQYLQAYTARLEKMSDAEVTKANGLAKRAMGRTLDEVRKGGAST